MNDKPIDLPNAQTTPEHANAIDSKDNNIPAMPQKDAPEKIKEGCGCLLCVAVVLILAGMILPAFHIADIIVDISDAIDDMHAVHTMKVAETTVDGVKYALYRKSQIFSKSMNVALVKGHTTDLPSEVTIPATVAYNKKEYTVTSIRYGAFRSCDSLTSVEISAGVTSIGSYAFEGCKSLTTIEIPASMTSIRDCAFRFCDELEKGVFLGDQPRAGYVFDETPNLPGIDFIEGKEGWEDGGRWCGKITVAQR